MSEIESIRREYTKASRAWRDGTGRQPHISDYITRYPQYDAELRAHAYSLIVHGLDAITCPTCGAVVESDALKKQTMADGSLMWPQPFCAACLVAGLKRLKAWLAAGGAGAMGEDGE